MHNSIVTQCTRATNCRQSGSDQSHLIQISSMAACTPEPWAAPLCSPESLQPRSFRESHCKYAHLPVCHSTSTNPTCTRVHHRALRRPVRRGTGVDTNWMNLPGDLASSRL